MNCSTSGLVVYTSINGLVCFIAGIVLCRRFFCCGGGMTGGACCKCE